MREIKDTESRQPLNTPNRMVKIKVILRSFLNIQHFEGHHGYAWPKKRCCSRIQNKKRTNDPARARKAVVRGRTR